MIKFIRIYPFKHGIKLFCAKQIRKYREEQMEKSIFREKSVNSIASPDSLNDYIRVVSPSVWVTMFAVITLLAGITIWGFVGHLDTVVEAFVVASDKGVVAYVNEKDSISVLKTDTIIIDGVEYKFDNANPLYVTLTMSENESILTMLGNTSDSTVTCILIKGDLPNGTYEGKVTVDSVKPMSFVTN